MKIEEILFCRQLMICGCGCLISMLDFLNFSAFPLSNFPPLTHSSSGPCVAISITEISTLAPLHLLSLCLSSLPKYRKLLAFLCSSIDQSLLPSSKAIVDECIGRCGRGFDSFFESLNPIAALRCSISLSRRMWGRFWSAKIAMLVKKVSLLYPTNPLHHWLRKCSRFGSDS